MKNIVIQGAGYVGSAFASVCANAKKKNKYLFKVSIVEKKEKKKLIDKINSGRFPHETNDLRLNKLFKSRVKKNLHATSDCNIYKKADIVVSCISFDCGLSRVSFNKNKKIYEKNIEEIAKKITSNTLIIIQSTLPPGFTNMFIKKKIENIFKSRKLPTNKILLAHSFERVMPGKNYFDSIANNWRVCAGINQSSNFKSKNFFSTIINTKKFPIKIFNNPIYSETTKILENSYRALNISLIDEWSRFCEESKTNLWSMIDAIRLRPTHNNIMSPGFGVGGHCLTKDPKFIEISSKYILKNNNLKFPLTSSALKSNNKMPMNIFSRIKKYFLGKLKRKKILILGLAYKEGVADTRKSPTETLFNNLEQERAIVDLHDPLVKFWPEKNLEVKKNFPNLGNYDVIVIAVMNEAYKKINFEYLNKIRKRLLILDTVNLFKEKKYLKLKKNIKIISVGK